MREKRERRTPNYLSDVIEAVDMMDAKKRLKEDFSNEHARAVKAIKVANAANGQGYISISKARTLIQNTRSDSKGKSETSRDKARAKASN